MHVAEMVQDYGILFYPVVFAWTFVEGETIVILSGAAARSGLLSIWGLIVCAWLGSFLGDQLWFLVSRRYGARVLARFPSSRRGMAVAVDLLEAHAVAFILTYRFVYGVRNVASLAIGASSISWGRFAALNFVSAGVWAVAFAGGGYLAGSAMKHVFGDAAGWASLALLAAFLGGGALLLRRRQKLRDAAFPEAAAPEVPSA